MNVIAVNGSPRKDWNTATLLGKALEGAAAQGASGRLIHLYDLDFTGCKSCFACKTHGGNSYGRCATRDELTPILAEICEAQALILGSPFYFGTVTGVMKSFLERLLFPYFGYDAARSTMFPGKLKAGFIYTMNATDEDMRSRGYPATIATNEGYLKRIFGDAESLCSCDTWQFEDYGAMVADAYDVARKKKRREEVFPQDCEAAFRLGARLVAG
jgi:multimeric flavodoxin WrbA